MLLPSAAIFFIVIEIEIRDPAERIRNFHLGIVPKVTLAANNSCTTTSATTGAATTTGAASTATATIVLP